MRKPRRQVVSGLNRAALAAVEAGVLLRGASAQCAALGYEGHDNGRGFFYWMHGIDSVYLVPRGARVMILTVPHYEEFDHSVLFHADKEVSWARALGLWERGVRDEAARKRAEARGAARRS